MTSTIPMPSSALSLMVFVSSVVETWLTVIVFMFVHPCHSQRAAWPLQGDPGLNDMNLVPRQYTTPGRVASRANGAPLTCAREVLRYRTVCTPQRAARSSMTCSRICRAPTHHAKPPPMPAPVLALVDLTLP